jgi:hypothetical protein
MCTSRLLLSLFAFAALAGSSGAGAQSLPVAPGEPEILPEISVVETMPRYPIKIKEASAIRGIYQMSNGWQLDVTPNWRQVYADLNGTGKVELLPVSADKFISADRKMAMEFNLGSNGNEMVMRYTPDGVAAHSVVLTSTLAQR